MKLKLDALFVVMVMVCVASMSVVLTVALAALA